MIGIDGYAPSLDAFREKMLARGLECETHSIEEIEKFVPLADVIITTTTSPTPLFDGALVRPGTLVSCVGAYQPHTREIDSTLVRRAAMVVVDTLSGALAEAGDILIPLSEKALSEADITEIGKIALGEVPGRQTDDDIIIFKTVGSAVQDVVVGHEIAQLAEEREVGTVVNM